MSTDHSCKLICDFRLKMSSLTSFVMFCQIPELRRLRRQRASSPVDGTRGPIHSCLGSAIWRRTYVVPTWDILDQDLGMYGYVMICWYGSNTSSGSIQRWSAAFFLGVTCQWIVRVYSA